MKERLGYLDGLKAVAMVLVFHIHFFNAYYSGVYTLDPASFHTRHGIEWWIGATPLDLIYAGKVGARLFLTVSAFLLVQNFWKKQNVQKLLKTPVTKYLRLVPPILVTNLLICLLMWLGAYKNGAAARLANSWETFGVYNQFVPNLLQAVKEAIWGCFLFGENRYNGPLWFIQYEFIGCTLLALVVHMTRKWKIWYRLSVYVVLAVLLVRTDYLCMVLGGLVGELYVHGDKLLDPPVWFAKSRVCKRWICKREGCKREGYKVALLWFLFLGCLFLLSYPSLGKVEGTMYGWLPPKVLFYYNVALPGLLYALLYLPGVQRWLDRPILHQFERISYCFYLVHFPVLCTLSAAFFVALYGILPYHLLTLLTYVIAFGVSVLLAWLMHCLVEVPWEALRRSGEKNAG